MNLKQDQHDYNFGELSRYKLYAPSFPRKGEPLVISAEAGTFLRNWKQKSYIYNGTSNLDL